MRWAAWISLFAAVALLPAAAPKETFRISGFIGNSSTEAASGVTVKLLEGETGKMLDMVRTGWTGRYKFENLKPGYYVIQANDRKQEVLVKAKDVRLDIDLSAKDGAMRYAKAEDLQKAISGALQNESSGGAAAPAGPSDPNLMSGFAGYYWGYSGSTEAHLMLCPSGTFMESSESSYSGSGRDSLGNQTMAWGAAGQKGSRGNWSIQGGPQQGTIQLSYAGGKTTSVNYRQVDSGCFSFNGRTLCRKGPPQCQ